MKRCFALLVAGLMCACCVGLAACGGPSGSSAVSGPSSSSVTASESASTASDGGSSASASEAASSATSDASSEVSPELKEAAENFVALVGEQVAIVEKAKAAGTYDAVKADWEALNARVDEVTAALRPWSQKYTDGELSDVDASYYDSVVVPAAEDSVDAGLELLDLI